MVTAIKKAARAAKGRKAQVKRGRAQAKPQTTAATPTVTSPDMSADQRIAAMGDNIRPFYTAFDSVVASVRKLNIDHVKKSDNQSLDMLLRLFEMRELPQVDLAKMALGVWHKGAVTQTANAVRDVFLRTYVPQYDAAQIAGARKWTPLPSYNKQLEAESVRDSEEAAAGAIRSMFEKVAIAAFYLEHVEARDLGTVKKGKSRALTFNYPFEGKLEPSVLAVTKLTANGRTVVAAKNTAAGKKPTAQSAPRTTGKKTETPQVAAQSAPVQSAATLAATVREMSSKDQTDFNASPSSEVLLANMIASRFVEKGTLDMNKVINWIATRITQGGEKVNIIGLAPQVPAPASADAPAKVA